MENYIPNIYDKCWVIRNNKLFYKKKDLQLILVETDFIYIYFNVNIIKKIIKLVEHLVKNNIKFYFLPMDEPYMDEDIEDCIIRNYLYSLVYKDFYYGFNKINFSLEDNLVEWAVQNNCFYKIKAIYDKVKININTYHFDYYTKNNIYTYDLEIRNYFNELMRNMQIKLMLI
jgi:hypothetical protein